MIRIYCDRCGIEILPPKKGMLYSNVHYGKVWLESFRNVNDEDTAIHTICEYCENDFIKWFNAVNAERRK